MEHERVEILPDRKKRIVLLIPSVGLLVLVWYMSPFMSVPFLVYTSISAWALIHLISRIFSNKPVLVLSSEGILSNMTINGKKAGLVLWKDVTDIRETKHLWFIRGIEVYTHASKGKFLLHLGDDEAAMAHDELLALLNTYWNRYR